MSQCFAYDCNHRAVRHDCKFFRFPSDKKMRKLWTDMSRRADTEPKAYHRLCSCHFLDHDKKNGPTIFLRNVKQFFNFKSPEERRKRRTAGKVHQEQSSDGIVVLVGRPASPPAVETPCEAVDGQNCEMLPTAELPTIDYCLQEMGALNAQNLQLKMEINKMKTQLDLVNTSLNVPGNVLKVQALLKNLEHFNYYTGLPSVEAFDCLLKAVKLSTLNYYEGWTPNLPLEEQLLLLLVKLRLNCDYTDLATRFQISRSSVRNIFLTLLYALHKLLFDTVVAMPSVHKNRHILLEAYKSGNCRCTIDCSEGQSAVSCSLNKQSATVSQHKSRSTFKALIACSPNGALAFVSQLYPGSTSDKDIFKDCKITSHLSPGDTVLADKGLLIADLLPPGVALNIPPFLTSAENKDTTDIAKARIEIKRVIGRFKSYNILDNMPTWCRPHASIIFQVVACLINLHRPLSTSTEDTPLEEN